jgi:hypothetical protein
MKWIVLPAALVAILAAQPAQAKPPDADVRQRIVEQSIEAYPGKCPCPYNSDRAGRRCGKRSAYDRPGGYSPKCYPSDVSEAEVKAYKASH